MAVDTPTGLNTAGLPVLTWNDYVVYQSPSSTAELDTTSPT